jgi:ABC-type multidrug transport system fused ATPase/permease subunit
MTATASSRLGFWYAVGVGMRAMRRHPALSVAFIIAVLSQGFLQGLLIWSIRNVLVMLSTSGANTSTPDRVEGAVFIFGIWLLRAAGVMTADSLAIKLATRVEHGWMFDVLRRLLDLPIAFFDRHSQGDLVMAAYHDLKGIRSSTLEVGRMILYLSQLGGLAVAAFMLSPHLALVGMLTVPLGAIPAYWFGQRITASADRERHAITSLHDSFLQVSSGIRAIRVNRLENRLIDRARRIGEDFCLHVIRQARHRSVARFLLESVSGIGLILILVLGGREVADGRTPWPTLMGLLVAVIALYQPVVNVLACYATLRSVLPNLDRVNQIMATPTGIPPGIGTARLRSVPATIELRDVSFGYGGANTDGLNTNGANTNGASTNGSDAMVLHAVNATFHRGETIGIVGPSGAGKSTLMGLLLGFYQPAEGAVLFDGVDERQIARADLMDLCAIVLQEPFLFGASIADNIRAGRPDASMADIVRAAEAAHIHDEILQMEHGYDTVLGRGATTRGLSVGQKQRVAIAAALLKNAPLLFLDEATSNLDAAAERKVQAAIDRVMTGRTTFVIAHRLSTLARADRILVLDRGRMVGFGPHQDLARQCEVYARLWDAQDLAAVGHRTRRARKARARV